MTTNGKGQAPELLIIVTYRAPSRTLGNNCGKYATTRCAAERQTLLSALSTQHPHGRERTQRAAHPCGTAPIRTACRRPTASSAAPTAAPQRGPLPSSFSTARTAPARPFGDGADRGGRAENALGSAAPLKPSEPPLRPDTRTRGRPPRSRRPHPTPRMRGASRAPLSAQRACAEAERRSPHGCAGAVPALSRAGQETRACAGAGAPCREAAWVGGARALRLRGGGGGGLWDTAAQAGCSGAMASSSGTDVIQVTNVSPSASSEQMRTLFGFLGKIEELRLFPPDDSPLPVSSRVCFVKFHDPDSAVVAQHLTNTVFVDRALIVVPYAEGVIPDETKALSLLAPANAVAGLLPGGGLLPTPNPLSQIGAVPLAALGAPALDPALAALGLPGANLNSQSLAADQLLKLMSTVDPKLNHVAAGLVSPSLKSDTSSKEIEEAMKRVREAQSLISAAIEPDKKDEKRRHSRSRSRSRRRRTPSSSRHRRSRSRSRRRSHSKSRSRRRSKSPRRRRSHSRERSRRSRSTSKTRDKKKEEKEKKRSKTPPKSYSTTRRSRSTSRERRRRRSRSGTRSPKKPRSPKRKMSRSPSPRRHKKEKKKDKDKERSRDERERSTSKKKKSKDKEKDRERKSESDKDVKVTRDYDEEEQGYDSEKEKKEEKKMADSSSPKAKESAAEKGSGESTRESKVNGDDHHEEDMDMSD